MYRDCSGRVRTVHLGFDEPSPDKREKPVRENLSAVAVIGNCLWFGTDEGTAIDRLTTAGLDSYAKHATFDLRQFLELPVVGRKGDEVDIEGFDIQAGYLWLVGSHATTRDKADPEKDGTEKAIRELEDTDARPNRRMLARVPLVERDGGIFEPVKAAPSSDGSGQSHVAQLKAEQDSSALFDALAGDKHLEHFLALPAKENGLDVEGIAVRDDRVFLGLRGPVLRGWAVVLELEIESTGTVLDLKSIGRQGRLYSKHFLDLNGCGVRDLCFAGDDLLVLAGPTMALDGPVSVHRWLRPLQADDDTMVYGANCRTILEVPYCRGGDRAEGMALLPDDGSELLVVYDTPSEDRRHGVGAVDADVFKLPA
jgi:hypothetical protein